MGSLRTLRRNASIEAQILEHRFEVIETGLTNGYPSIRWLESSVSCSVFSLSLMKGMEESDSRQKFWCVPGLRIVARNNSPHQTVGLYGHGDKQRDLTFAAEILQGLIDVILAEKSWQSLAFPYEWIDLEQLICPPPEEMARLLPPRSS